MAFSIVHTKNTVYDQNRVDFFTKKLATASKEKNMALVNMYATEIEITKSVIDIQSKNPKNYLTAKERRDTSSLLTTKLEEKMRFYCNIRDNSSYGENEFILNAAFEGVISAIEEKETHDAYCKFRDLAEVLEILKENLIAICNAAPKNKKHLTYYWNEQSENICKMYLEA